MPPLDWTAPLLRASAAAAVAAVFLVASPPAGAQQRWSSDRDHQRSSDRDHQHSSGRDRHDFDHRANWAESAVFGALERSTGTDAYQQAMEAATNVLARQGLLSRRTENYYDRRAFRSNFANQRAASSRRHAEVLNVLVRNRNTPAYYDAMSAAADELRDASLLPDAAASYFDRMSQRSDRRAHGAHDRR